MLDQGWTEEQHTWMGRALILAERGRGQVKPNPLVGCVLVKDGAVIAEGWHDHLGGLHAEQMAIADAERNGHSPNGSTAYVTLEPCNHHGRTPPCTEALLWAGVKQVIVAHRDPNPLVRGQGIQHLRAQGVPVEEGLGGVEAATQMQSFLHWCEYRRPLVTLKMAFDANGAVDDRTTESKRFTSESSLDAVHRLRRDMDAVVIGVETVVRDDPLLTVRRTEMGHGFQPMRVILDRGLRIPLDARLLQAPGRTLILHCEGQADSIETLQGMDRVEVHRLKSDSTHGGVDLELVLSLLGDHGHQEILLEGGPDSACRFLDSGLIDRAIIIRTEVEFDRPVPGLIGETELAGAGLKLNSSTSSGEDSIEAWSRPELGWPATSWP